MRAAVLLALIAALLRVPRALAAPPALEPTPVQCGERLIGVSAVGGRALLIGATEAGEVAICDALHPNRPPAWVSPPALPDLWLWTAELVRLHPRVLVLVGTYDGPRRLFAEDVLLRLGPGRHVDQGPGDVGLGALPTLGRRSGSYVGEPYCESVVPRREGELIGDELTWACSTEGYVYRFGRQVERTVVALPAGKVVRLGEGHATAFLRFPTESPGSGLTWLADPETEVAVELDAPADVVSTGRAALFTVRKGDGCELRVAALDHRGLDVRAVELVGDRGCDLVDGSDLEVLGLRSGTTAWPSRTGLDPAHVPILVEPVAGWSPHPPADDVLTFYDVRTGVPLGTVPVDRYATARSPELLRVGRAHLVVVDQGGGRVWVYRVGRRRLAPPAPA